MASGATAGLLCCIVALTPSRSEDRPLAFAAPRDEPKLTFDDAARAHQFREAALRAAEVFAPTDVSSAALDRNPPDPSGSLSQPIVRCRFVAGEAKGTTPKFRCLLPDGEVIKVKYGGTGEIPAELAATRLLTALGFGADRMYLIPRLRCYGCPRFPFHAVWVLDRLRARDLVTSAVPEERYTDFEWAAVERRFDGIEITAEEKDGWAWFELDQVDTKRGASRAEIDALRLLARFLAHWDNKAANQRLVCRSVTSPAPDACPDAFAYVQDLGATFGPNKVNLASWEQSGIWADPSRCTVSMKDFPYDGGTFNDVQISEAGRELLTRQLKTLTEVQIETLFAGARFQEFQGPGRPVEVKEWTRVFRNKVREIASNGRCPS